MSIISDKQVKMSKILTERDIITKLLLEYKNKPCLWDTSHKDYFNKQLRQQSYESLLVIWQQFDPNGTVKSVKRKLEHFRSSYRRQWKKVADSVTADVTSDGERPVYKPNLWYYNLMTFLSVDVENREIVDEESERATSDKKRRVDGDGSDKEDPDDYVTTYGLTIAKQLKELDDDVRYEAERMISDVIYRARTGTLPKYNPSAVDFIIPKSEPSWYDLPMENSGTQSSECLVVTMADPTETQTSYTSDQIIKTEFEETDDYSHGALE